MGTATVLIGMLPASAAIGVLAPLPLTLLRFLQGFGFGGEWGGTVALVVEHEDARVTGLHGSVMQTGGGICMVLWSWTIALLLGGLDGNQMMQWG